MAELPVRDHVRLIKWQIAAITGREFRGGAYIVEETGFVVGATKSIVDVEAAVENVLLLPEHQRAGVGIASEGFTDRKSGSGLKVSAIGV